MTRYNNPQQLNTLYSGSFVRCGNAIHIGPVGDFDKDSADIAFEDELFSGDNSIRTLPPEELDSGLLDVLLSSDGKGSVFARGRSTTLGLPRTETARIRTGEILTAMHPGFRVDIKEAGIGPSPERR
ncbi:MAG: hypothetical protein AAB520_01415 [Patescibacteria group bacterium]